MKISSISDVHVKKSGDNAEKLLLSFLRSPDVAASDVIFLLGDIFDLMVGPHSQYFVHYQSYFDEIKKLIKHGKKICYIEGNHDFHIEKLYENFFSMNPELDANLFQISSFFEITDKGKKFYFAHGDDVELGNPMYKIYKKIVTSPPLRYFANYLVPHFVMKNVGEYSSNVSRKKNNKKYSMEADLLPVLENFRQSAEVFFNKMPVEIIVLGHSHVKDHYVSPRGFQYVNNGYVQHTKTYVSIDDGNISFKEIF